MKKIKINYKTNQVFVDGKLLFSDDSAESLYSIRGFKNEEVINKGENGKGEYVVNVETSVERYEEVIEWFTNYYSVDINKFENILEQAKESGERKHYYSYTEQCRSKYEQCDIDQVNVYITPESEIEKERIHTY